MQLIYDNVTNFEPVNNNLSRWKGRVGTIAGTSIPVHAEIIIPPAFPNMPPKVLITPKLNHPNVSDDGELALKILAEWQPTYHVYQVILEIRKLFNKVPPKPYKTKRRRASTTPTEQRMPQRHPIVVQPIQPRRFTYEQSMDQSQVERRTLQEEIAEYQKQIEQLNNEIDKERASLLQQRGISVAESGKEMTISVDEALNAEIYAIDQLLELLSDKFEDGDVSAVDYFKLFRKYSKNKYSSEKKLLRIKSGKSDKMKGNEDKQLELEAELFASIVTLDTLARSYENHEIEPIAYKKQLRSLIKDIFKVRMNLEKLTHFNIEDFIKRERLEERYPKGIKSLRMAEGTETAEAEVIPFESLKKMPAKTADFVSAAIELLDLTRLKSVARAELILADLEEMLHIISTFPAIPKDHWMVSDLENWKKVIGKYNPQDIIKEDECEKLEFQASRWLNEFRRLLKDL